VVAEVEEIKCVVMPCRRTSSDIQALSEKLQQLNDVVSAELSTVQRTTKQQLSGISNDVHKIQDDFRDSQNRIEQHLGGVHKIQGDFRDSQSRIEQQLGGKLNELVQNFPRQQLGGISNGFSNGISNGFSNELHDAEMGACPDPWLLNDMPDPPEIASNLSDHHISSPQTSGHLPPSSPSTRRMYKKQLFREPKHTMHEVRTRGEQPVVQIDVLEFDYRNGECCLNFKTSHERTYESMAKAVLDRIEGMCDNVEKMKATVDSVKLGFEMVKPFIKKLAGGVGAGSLLTVVMSSLSFVSNLKPPSESPS
jgi:archaellum component FlaC